MKRFFSIISLIFGIGIIFLLIIALAYRERITQHAVGYISEQIESHTGYKVQCGHVSLAFPMKIQIECVKVMSENNPQLFIDNLEVQITPWGALRRHIVIDKVQIGTLSILSTPELSSSGSVDWSTLPGSIKIDSLIIDRFYVAPETMSALNLSKMAHLVSQEVPMRIAGRMSIDPFSKNFFADFLISETAQPENTTHLIASLTQIDEDLDLHLRLTETKHGLIADQFDLPRGYTFQGIAHAKAPRAVWEKLSSADQKNFDPAILPGDFQISYSAEPTEMLPYLGQYGFIKGPFTLNESYTFTAEKLEGLIGDILVQGSSTITSNLRSDGTKLQLSMRRPFETPQIKVQHIHADCFLSGDLLCPNIVFSVNGSGLDIRNRHFDNVHAKGNMNCEMDVLNGHMSLKTQYEGQDWTAKSGITYNISQQLLGLSHLHVQAGEANLAGNIQLDIPEKLLLGELEGISDLSLLQDFFDQKVQGVVSWRAHFYPQLDEHDHETDQELDLYIKTNQLQVDDWTIERPNIIATLDNPFTKPSGMLSISCQKAVSPAVELHDIMAETVINPGADQWPFKFSCKQQKLDMHAAGSWHADKERFTCTLDKLEGDLDNHAFALQEPCTIKKKLDSLTITPLSISIGEGSILASIEAPKGFMQVRGNIRNIPLDLLQLVNSEVKVLGTVTGEAILTDSPSGVFGKMELKLSNAEISSGEFSTPNPWQGLLKAELRNNQLTSSGQIVGIAPKPIEFSAILPVTATMNPFSLIVEKDKDLSARVVAQGNIEHLLELALPASTTHLTGQTTLGLNITGSLNNPLVKGQMDLVGGTFEILDIGTSIKNVQAHFNIDGKNLTMTTLTGVGQEAGKIVGSGSAMVDPELNFPFDFSYQLDHLGMRPLTSIFLTASGPLRIHGDAKGGQLEGYITSDSFQMVIPEKIPELAQSIQIKYVNQPEHLPPPTSFEKKDSIWPLTFNVNLEIPNQGKIQGKDWTSEWKGKAVLSGDTDHWEMHGLCKIIKGEYLFNGKSFEINQGTITFDGEPDKNTSLYVIASKDIDAHHVEIILKGDVNHPAIAFRSNPPMSQREILSWILFGRGTSDINTFQGTQLNDSITDLKIGNRPPDVLTQIRESFGVDKIDICNNDNGTTNEVSLQVGKYISKGVLVSVQKSITAEANRLSIEADLIKYVKIQAEIGDDADAHLNLKWKRDY